MEPQDDKDHFLRFAQTLERKIATYNEPDANAYELQKAQMEGLVALEAEFKATLIAHPYGAKTYRRFVDFIRLDRNNILDARPYFRELKQAFTAGISPALKLWSDEEPFPVERLYPFAINYQFVCFVMKSRRGSGKDWGPTFKDLAARITRLRQEIVEMNLPLAINRARIFQRSRRAHLTHMDLVQISCNGLMDAVDKFVLPFNQSFRDVIIGRIVGNFIEENSRTMMHFYPVDRRKLYRANKASSRIVGGVVDFEALAAVVNTKTKHRFSTKTVVGETEEVPETQKTNGSEIAELLSASTCLTLDPTPTEQEEGSVKAKGHWDVAPETSRPDIQAEHTEIAGQVSAAITQLTVFEKKVLKLRGVSL